MYLGALHKQIALHASSLDAPNGFDSRLKLLRVSAEMVYKCLTASCAVLAALFTGYSHAQGGPAPVPPLVDFQVAQPLTFPSTYRTCVVEVIHHNFGNSYYQPAIAQWTPPTACGDPSQWVGVSGNYTATSNGTQYDRLSAVTFQNVEIWRTSTAEPSTTGIIWTALKDLSHYIPLFEKSGTIILDLNNVLDPGSGLDGEYDVTFSITIYSAPNAQRVQRADAIVALGTLSPNQAAYTGVPPRLSTSVKLPQNTAEAYAEIYASGNSQEEFWYFNTPDEWLSALPPDTTLGKGPFMEVQLRVDGQLAGFASPYPVVFTGANLPLLWRPMVAYGAFDQPTYKVDLTPFVPLLADGKNHNVSIDVVSAEPDHTILSNWYVSGNIQVVLDPSGEPTTGNITKYTAPDYAQPSITGVTSRDGLDVNITVSAQHILQIEADIVTGSGKKSVVWQQNYDFSNTQVYTDNASTETAYQTSSGHSQSTHNGEIKLKDDFNYPLTFAFWNIDNSTSTGWGTSLDHSYERSEVTPFVVPSTISTHRFAEGETVTSVHNKTQRRSDATGQQTFMYGDTLGNVYWRNVATRDGAVTSDEQGGFAQVEPLPQWSFVHSEAKAANASWPVRIHKP